MSALYPLYGGPAAKAGDVPASAREAALLQEIEALRHENQLLRQQYARQLAPETPDADLPVVGLGVKPASQAQLEYEALFSALASVFPIGVFRTDAVGMLTHVDESLCRIFALEATDFPNFGWFARLHPDDVDQVRAHWAKGIGQGESLNVEFRIQRPDNDIGHVLVRNVPQRDARGQLFGHLGFVQDVSRLRTLEADAQIKDQLNRQIIASSPDCTKVLDLDARLLQMTQQGCKLVEVDDFEQVRGSDWTTWWPDDGHDVALDAVKRARRGEHARFFGFAPTFKGRGKWWDTLISPILDANGSPVMLLAVSRDVTEQHERQDEVRRLNAELEQRVKERTEELALANERLQTTLSEARALYDHAPCGYYSLDMHGVVQMMNQTALNWLGRTREEVEGKLCAHDLVQPEYLAQQEARREQLMRTGRLDPEEVSLKLPDGRPFVALASSTAVYDENGQFLRTNSTLLDITARKAAEAALHAQRSFLQAVTNTVPVQLAFFDRELSCRFANAAYARWTGGSPDDLVGMHLSQIAPARDYEPARERLAAALRGESQRFEGERTFPDGHRFYASVEYTPYRQDGEVQGLIIQMLDITERKASEDSVQRINRQLHEALSLSQALYDHAPCGYHSLDRNGVFVSINDTELGWLGYTREEVIGRLSFRDIVLPERATLLADRLQRLIAGVPVENVEYAVRRKDGSIFHALLSSSAVRDLQGEFLRSNTTVVDISARKAAEAALRDQQRFMQTITDHVPGLIAYLDASLRFRFANLEHHRLLGLDPEKITGLHISQCVSPTVWQEVEPRLKAALRGEPQHFETWRTTVDGAPMFIRASYLPDLHKDAVQGVFIQLIDITARKQVEERVKHLNIELETRIRERSAELLESEQRFRLMVDNLREYCIFFLDAQGRITDWTDSAQRMEGYSPTEVVGRHYSVLFRGTIPEASHAKAEQMLRLAASRGQHELQSWHERKDGTRYFSHSLLIALRDDSGELQGFARINRDMTDAKRLDDLMRNINDELENRVAERTEQLLAANKELESFSYSVSHDLRSPLRHISSFVSLLEEHLHGRTDEATRKYLNTIANSARHMSQLIDGLLAFSRLGRAAVNMTSVDFALLVDAVVAQLAHDTEGRTIEWVIAPDLPVVQGDGLLLREVWANLLGNAYKYTRPRACARIEIGWSVDPAVGYTFYVRDNGVGFDTKYSQKLFGVFQRLHRASEFEGTGIGLALTRRIIERHGGSIWAESRLGEGSVFHFSLPFESAPSSDSAPDSFLASL
ncbi:PAS domain-containing sensor histidine kinase [Hydrogenophaga electricum]|uniref:histidine kinase n=1 Tax=Hydrogenophaga electricum TaxID=1230953 RepID=A0ABQ6C6B4_9BURK|nr:PAS domain S-box protein [Hydrogenophaga electricum]GLS15654.1 hypothetical protein GCM10007935_30900 [Hydrogenophaga electricum]